MQRTSKNAQGEIIIQFQKLIHFYNWGHSAHVFKLQVLLSQCIEYLQGKKWDFWNNRKDRHLTRFISTKKLLYELCADFLLFYDLQDSLITLAHM